MPDTKTSNPANTIARHVVGVGSVVGFAWSMWILVLFLSAIPIFAMSWDTVLLLNLGLRLGSPLGYLLVADLCLRRWRIVEHREGTDVCEVVLTAVLVVGAVGTFSIFEAFPQIPFWTSFIVVVFGFWMLWGFVLASVIRKWRRMKREANAE